ncbi:MAG: alpha-L-glutamate ligase-like protein, partial [Betaproteobacteria bacterium]|nr:alpha-L-glutamate ligase-like protein [Betaproteobacteria bacterium]
IQHEVPELASLLSARQDFVVKPARGSQGDGILVVTGRSGNHYRLADGGLMDQPALEFHVSNILSGVFSLGGQTDRAMIEYRVNFDPVFEKITFRGVPDVRIIVFLGVPVMAMVRLPTRAAKGKANLHQGAIGSGVDISTGRTMTAVRGDQVVSEHPDTGNPVRDVQVPRWDTLLEIAARSFELTGLGYLGVDIVLDRDLGPMILELNARPGLNIQIANRAGLRPRLDAVLANRDRLRAIDERLEFAKERFGAQDPS